MQLHNFIDVFNAFRVNYRIFPSNNQLKHYSIAYIRRKRQNNTPKSIESASKIPLSSIIGWNNPNSVSIDIFRNDSSWMHYSYRIRNFTIGDHHIIKQSLTWALIMIWIIARIVTSHYCISCLFLSFALSQSLTLYLLFQPISLQHVSVSYCDWKSRTTTNNAARNTISRKQKRNHFTRTYDHRLCTAFTEFSIETVALHYILFTKKTNENNKKRCWFDIEIINRSDFNVNRAQ